VNDAIYIAAPPGTHWPLDLDTLDLRLQERFPDLRAFLKHAPVRDQDYLDFQTTLEGLPRHGTYFDRTHLILRDAPASLWAETIAWFLSLLPPDAEAVAMLETNPEHTAPMPRTATPEQITALLDELEQAE
jgi:hypothetical protein